MHRKGEPKWHTVLFNAGPGKAPDEDVVRTDQIGIPGGIATLDANGHLTESQRWEVDSYKKAETDQRISAAVDAHNEAATPTATSAPAWQL